jgi:hypothetical protein
LIEFHLPRPILRSAIVISAVLSILVACGPTKPPVVTYIIPKGFRGLVCVVESSHGAEIDPDLDQTVEVPTTGVVLVKSHGFETHWHQEQWRSRTAL